MQGPTTYSEMIRRRMQDWWGAQPTVARRLHRRKEQLVRRRATDPDDLWRCCERWQRSLANKWNAREFARRHGCQVPELYWYGRALWRLPFARLPPRYVIRPVYGRSTRGTYLIDGEAERLGGRPLGAGEVRGTLVAEHGRFSRIPVLVEEFLRSEDGEYRVPVDYKCHMFGETLGVIERVERLGRRSTDIVLSYYDADWRPLERMVRTDKFPHGPAVPPPRCADGILDTARRLGRAYGTYVRVDVYATDRGCVFGEFSPTPTRGEGYSDFGDEYLLSHWRSALPLDFES